MGPLAAPAADTLCESLEDTAAQYTAHIREALSWHDSRWAPLEHELVAHAFRWAAFLGKQPPNPAPHGEFLRLRDAVVGPLEQELAARANAVQGRQIAEQLRCLAETLDRAGNTEGYVTRTLREAVEHRDTEAYRRAFDRLVDLHNRRTALTCRRELLARLETSAPGWAGAIRARSAPHDAKTV